MKPPRVINIHSHLRTRDDLAERVRIWREWNVEKFCCQCMPAHRVGGTYTHDEFLAAQRKYPDLLVGFAGVNLSVHGIDSAGDIQRYCNQGFAGLKFIDPCLPYNHEAYHALYDAAERLGMPILFHTGYLAGEGKQELGFRTDSEKMSPYKFDAIARAFPKLKIIGAHLGNPEFPVALGMMDYHANVHFDFTGGGGKIQHVRKVLAALLPHPGMKTDMANPDENRALAWFKSQLLFGTDNPEPSVWIPASEIILDALEIPPDVRDCFYYRSAAALLGLPV